MSIFQTVWQEDGSCTVLGRLTARDGTGAATGVPGEGNWIKQADMTSITCAVFDRRSTTPDTSITTPSVSVASAIIDTPVTSNTLWTADTTGYNFIHDLGPLNFPTSRHIYLVEYKFTTTGGAVLWGKFCGPATETVTS